MAKLIQFLTITVIFGNISAEFDDISRKCKSQFLHFNVALKNQKPWALKLFDTWAKLQSGVSNGNVYNFGDFDGCIAFTHETHIAEVGSFSGKHCMIQLLGSSLAGEDISKSFNLKQLGILSYSQSLLLKSGICVPDACSVDDAREIAIYALSTAQLNVTSAWCESNHPIPFRIRIVAIVIFAMLLLAVILATIYELHMRNQQKSPQLMLIAFSAYTNSRNLFQQKTNELIECVDGLRALSLLWIIFGHRFFDMFGAPASNSKFAIDSWFGNIFSVTQTTFHLAIDTFFLIEGLLVTWTFMKAFDSREFNVFKAFFHRFMRYTPLLLFLLLFFISFSPYLGSGPIYDQTLEQWLPNCYIYWWSTLLHVANYTNVDKLCLNWTWYLSVDFQLFVLSPLLVYPAWRWRWKFFIVFPMMIFLSKVYIFTISMINELPVFVGILQSDKQVDYERLIYYPTHARCGPWLVGMSLGFVMYQFRSKPPRLCKYISEMLWILTISVIFAIMLGYFPFQQPDKLHDIPNIVSATYNAFLRSSWAISLAWIIFACQNGNGGIVNWFLCLPYFKPLSRMSLSIYLSHRVPQILSVASIKQPIHLDPLDLFHMFLGDILQSFVIGIVVYLSIEAPIAKLESKLLTSNKVSK